MSNGAASNVISMREFDRPAPVPQHATQFDRLLKECEDLALIRLTASVSVMLDKAGDALRQQSDQTTDRDQRELYNKTRDTVVDKRRAMEDQFRTQLQAEFRTRATRERKEGQQFAKFDLSSLELGLVNDDDLEETLKVSDMATKLRRYCEEELAALDQRVGVLVGDATLQGDANPFSPQAVLGAFKLASRQVEPELRIRMILLKLFDDHVLDEVRSVYRDLNDLLVQRSILPKIRYSVKRGPGAAGAHLPGPLGSPAAAIAAAAQLAGAPLDGNAGGGEQDFFATLQALMANLAGAGAGRAAPGQGNAGTVAQIPGFPPILGAGGETADAGGVPNGGRILQGGELLGSLTRIQHGDVSTVSAGDLPLAATLADPGTVNVLRQLKSTGLAGGMAQMDRLTLDIVAMLFDQIFDDRKISTAMKALIGRLQIPVLKVAILDKAFFSSKQHPAREFLDTLGEVALGLDAQFNTESPLYQALERIVQKLIDDFNDRVELFVEVHEELKRVVAEDSQRAEQEAQRVAKAIEQKEKLEVAKAIAQQEIRQRAKTHTIPRLVLAFLSEHWVKLLLIAHAKHGPDSAAWKSAIETMDLLIWSVTSKQSLEERRKLATRLPPLLKRLNFGMQLVHADEAARKRFFAKLMRCHTKVMNGTIGQVQPAAQQRSASQGAAQRGAVPAPEAARPTARAAELPTLTDVAGDASLASARPLTDAATKVSARARPEVQASTVERTGTAPTPAADVDEDIAPAEAPPTFSAVTLRNPFGEGEIEVEEISLSDVPFAAGGTRQGGEAKSADEHSQMASSLKEGAWVEFRDGEDNRTQARLSYISPLKGTYLFVNRQGRKVGEYSLYQLARELRSGNAQVIDGVPLIDRAMSSLVGALRMSAPAG
jgi:hypothetical protein